MLGLLMYFMNKPLYTIYLFLYLTVQFLTYLITPLLPLFSVSREGGLNNNSEYGYGIRLPLWLSWFDTRDNPITGDDRFYAQNLPSYINMVKWLYRNSLYGFKWSVLALNKGDPRAWQYKREFGYIRVNLGWMLDNPEQGKLMFQFSIRRAKSKL